MELSWVMIDRVCERRRLEGPAERRRPLRSDAVGWSEQRLLAKLGEIGVGLDRAGLEARCAGAVSVQDVAVALFAEYDIDEARFDADWVWICLCALWARWWPSRVCLEVLDDQIQAGYGAAAGGPGVVADTWLRAWSGVLALAERAGIDSIGAFDDRFGLSQSVFNWIQDLDDALAGLADGDPVMRGALTRMREQARRRFGATPLDRAVPGVGLRPEDVGGMGVVSPPVARVSCVPVRVVKVGRNAPCPCGSGAKFKKCCGSPARPAGAGQGAGVGRG